MTACYSFTGGSIPEHIKTLKINNVQDNSGYGNPQFREDMLQFLVQRFITDNSFNLTDENPNARLSVAISSIRDETVALSPGELETERKVTVDCKVEYYDLVKKKVIFEKKFNNFQLYDLSNALVNRNNAVTNALEQLANDILLGVVSGW